MSEVESLNGGLGRAGDLFHEAAQVRLLDGIKATGTVLGREIPLVQRVADERPIAVAVVGLEFSKGHDLVDDPGQFEPGLGAVDLQREDPSIEIVEGLIQDADEPHVLATRVLQVRKPADHFLAHQTVGATAVGLAGFLGVGLRLSLAPLQAQTSGHGDRVDEDGLVLVEDRRITEARANGIEVSLAVGLVFAQCRVRAADEDGEVAALLPCTRADRVARPTLDGEEYFPALQIFFDLFRYCLWKFKTRRKLPRIIELSDIYLAILDTILTIKPKLRRLFFNNRLIANTLQALG